MHSDFLKGGFDTQIIEYGLENIKAFLTVIVIKVIIV